jgi:hypothetical protein
LILTHEAHEKNERPNLTMNPKTWRKTFNIAGACILCIWLIALGLWVKVLHFDHPAAPVRATDASLRVRTSQEDWMEIYLKGKKVGYALRQLSPAGGEGYLVRDEILLRLSLMGRPNTVQAVTRAALNPDFTLKTFTFTITSGVVTFSISGTVRGKRMELETGEGRMRRRESLTLSSPPMIPTSLAAFFRGRDLKVGQSFRFPMFDPSLMAQREVSVRVAGREKVRIRGIDYDALRLEADIWGREMRFWVGEDGAVLKEEGFLGLTLIKSSAATAEVDIDVKGGEDLYGLASVPVRKAIWHPERLTSLKLRVSGAEGLEGGASALDGGRQHFKDGNLDIIREKVPQNAPYPCPFPDKTGAMKAYLQPEFGVESDQPAVIDRLKEIAGAQKDPVALSRKLLNWVYRRVEKRPVMSVPSALQVLETMQGDCNEHAALLAALLRAAGIPARICAGLVFRQGAFYYHAWNEAYLGRWVTLDATLNQFPADATHIKLVEGGPESQAQLIAVIGKLNLEVAGYGYD